MNYLQPERLERLAREYALGTLNGRARRRFERVLRDAPAAARAVGEWQRRFDVLAASVPAMPPREAVWQGLQSQLFAPPGRVAAPASGALHWVGQVLSGRSLAGALAGVLLAVVLLRMQPGLLGLEPSIDKLPESYVGLLTDGAGKPTLLASSRRHGRVLTVKLLQPINVPPGQVAQLWALPKNGSAPLPIGTIPDKGSATVTLADSSEKLFFTVTQLGVSFEAAPAKAGDKPSGDFVLRGHCVKLW